ncbi:YcnI family protein [Caldimonas brevitalea]|uniref:YncI copper-binding domain-containing protein n=1 Tax=Caldimonas brevitalea TaxID=413882 RepID=A0A0G3BI78_9BURK|nr:YcnI family protein [Caldimonas brevitalea]AKJ29154.1 hypothetical protein AAW51_2463 [Caldimonas brevitalea]
MTTLPRLGLGALLAAAAVCADAHVTIADPKAQAGSYHKVTLQVPHGCAGSATVALAVHVPPAFLVAKPAVKPGWSVRVEKTRLDKPAVLHGRSINETTSVIRWEGGAVPGDFFDEFSLHGRIADGAKGKLAFRVVQTCEKGEVDWNGPADSATPAPTLEVSPADAGHGHHHH